jgi:hypothetical protein
MTGLAGACTIRAFLCRDTETGGPPLSGHYHCHYCCLPGGSQPTKLYSIVVQTGPQGLGTVRHHFKLSESL